MANNKTALIIKRSGNTFYNFSPILILCIMKSKRLVFLRNKDVMFVYLMLSSWCKEELYITNTKDSGILLAFNTIPTKEGK